MSFGANSFGATSFGALDQPATGGAVTHTATATLNAQSATLSGASSRTGAAVTHTASATLTASSATLSGAASRTSASGYDYRIAVIGDSNASGRGSFSQTNSAASADLYDVSGSVVTLADPWDAGTDTYSVLSDAGSAAGSYVQHLADLFDGAGKSTLWIPANKGGTTSTSWAYSTLTSTCYGAMKARIDAAGGVDVIIIHLGANDAIGGMSQATFTSNMNAIIGHLATDFPTAKLYLQKIHHNSSATTTNIDNIRAAVDDIWANNASIRRGADLEGISTGVHYGQTGNTTTCTSELNEVALRTYNALMAVTHTASASLHPSSATVSGSSSRTAAIVTHTATASLSASSASVHGTASRSSASTGGLSPADIAAIVAAVRADLAPELARIDVAISSRLSAASPTVDVRQMNGATVVGDGSEANPWRGVGVSP